MESFKILGVSLTSEVSCIRTTKVPLFSNLIAKREYQKLDNIFDKTMKQSISINIVILSIMYLGLLLMKCFNDTFGQMNLSNRFLSYIPMLLLMISLVINQAVNSWAIYLRCHKREPYLINSIIGAILCSLSTIIAGQYWGVIGITWGYFLIALLMFIWAYKIFNNKKNEWHRY